MPKRKVYVAIGSPAAKRPKAAITVEYSTEDQLLDAQAKVAEYMADEFYREKHIPNIVKEVGQA